MPPRRTTVNLAVVDASTTAYRIRVYETRRATPKKLSRVT